MLDVRYAAGFEGTGRIGAVENGDGSLSVRDEWLDVRNRSAIPSRMAEVGHSVVAGAGFDDIGRRARR